MKALIRDERDFSIRSDPRSVVGGASCADRVTARSLYSTEGVYGERADESTTQWTASKM